MKNIIIYGPGTSPVILVEDAVAEEITQKFKKGEAFEVNQGNAMVYVREKSCWAIKVEDFKDRRRSDDQRQQ